MILSCETLIREFAFLFVDGKYLNNDFDDYRMDYDWFPGEIGSATPTHGFKSVDTHLQTNSSWLTLSNLLKQV
jgi:hypothetical protein